MTRLNASTRAALSSRWLVPLGLLLICIIGYAPLINSLGLYWDDWPSLWFLHFFGPGIFPQAFAADRPVQGFLFTLTTSLVGESLLAWHIFGILARWLSGLSLYWVLASLWPERKLQVTWVAALFLLYPGFMQQYIPITYGHQFLIMSIFFLSLALMVRSIRKPRAYWLLTSFSLLTAILTMFSLEYYFGLELLRPVFLWLLADQTSGFGRRLWITCKRWLIYAFADLAFLFWRLTHATPRGEVTLFKNLALDPALTLSMLVKTILNDIFESAVVAWGRMFAYLNFSALKLNLVLGYAAVAVTAALVAFLLFLLLQKKVGLGSSHGLGEVDGQPGAAPRLPWGLQALLVGVCALLVAGWPIWVTDLRLELSVPWDRFTQPFMLGACLVLVGLLDFLLRPHILKLIVISLLVGLAAGAQFHYAFAYRLDWTAQKRFFWQLAWRIPALVPGTLLLTSNLPFLITTDNSLSAPLNWIYAPKLDTLQMPFLMYDLSARLGNRLPELTPGIAIYQEYRATEFHGSTSQALVFYYDPPRCLKVLDSAADRLYPNKPDSIVAAMSLSRPELILPGAPSAPQMPSLFGPEPAHDWCYYFEQIEQAVQQRQWDQAVKLADQALQSKPALTRDNAAELIPLIIAYARSARYDRALELSLTASKLSDKLSGSLCDTWYTLSRQIPADAAFQSVFASLNQEIQCPQP